MLIIGGEIRSFCALSGKNLIVPLKDTDEILVTKNWKVINKVQVSNQVALGQHLLLPGFDIEEFPFVVTYANNSYDLINVSTGRRDALIKDSAKNDGRWPATFFINHRDDRIDMHFCTLRLNEEDTFEHAWHCLELNADFINVLKKCGRLPIDSMNEQVEILRQFD